MAPLPKKKHSRERQGKRRAAISYTLLTLVNCSNCKNPKVPHQACPTCGFYKGQKVVNKAEKVKVSKTSIPSS